MLSLAFVFRLNMAAHYFSAGPGTRVINQNGAWPNIDFGGMGANVSATSLEQAFSL